MAAPSKIKSGTINAILKHAKDGYPNEICGVVVITDKGVEKYIPCVNIAKDPTNDFKMCPQSYADAEDQGEVVGICHSHPDATTQPSAHDIAVMSSNRELELLIDPTITPTPWHIVSWPEGDYRQVVPEVREAILGRPFVHNVWDCWQACNDYYNRYHGLTFPRYQREDGWWEVKDGPSWYVDQFEAAGFYQVNSPEPGDLIVMQIGRTFHPNHAGVYLGNVEKFEDQNLYGGPFMLHHMYGKKAEIIVYGGQWQNRTRMVLRHKDI